MLKLSIFLGALGGIMILLAAILGAVVFPRAVDNKIKSELRLVRGSSTWNKWVEIETPVYIKFYIFHVTNPEEVNDGTASPKLETVGPYVYRQRRQKLDPLSENCKETVKYEQRITYFFDQEKSGNKTEEDVVNIVNVAFVSVMKSLATKQPQYVPIVANQLLTMCNETLIRSGVTVGEVTFRGFDVSCYNKTAIGGNLPEEFSGLRFGIYKGRNGSTDGQYEVFTGANDVKLFGSIKTWNGNSSLPYWGDSDDDKCNKLTGTDGSIFRPFLEKESTIHIFSSDVCRQLRLTYKEEKTVKNIKGYRFTLPKDELEAGAYNSCYCTRNETECWNGIIDISVCRNEAPIVLSTPNFLDGHEDYASAMGLVPNRSLHETTIDLEPRSGLLLEAHKRIQINLNVRRIENVTQLEPIHDPLLFPVLWIDEEARICDVDAKDFRSRVQSPIKTVKIVKWVAIGVGSALVIAGFLIPFLRRNRKSSLTV